MARVRSVSWYIDNSWIEECRLSDANSASRNRPGMIYVSDRNADSICVTELWFFVMKSAYMLSHLGGNASGLGTCRRVVFRESRESIAMDAREKNVDA